MRTGKLPIVLVYVPLDAVPLDADVTHLTVTPVIHPQRDAFSVTFFNIHD